MILPWPPGKPRPPRAAKPKCEHDIKILKDASGKAFGFECSKCRKKFTRDVCEGCQAIHMNPARADRTSFLCRSCT